MIHFEVPSRLRTVGVTGGRNYQDWQEVEATLDTEWGEGGEFILVDGGCPTGADKLARDYARKRGIVSITHNAKWTVKGNAAGPIRNREMMAWWGIDVLYQFPGGRGTADCVRAAETNDVFVRATE